MQEEYFYRFFGLKLRDFQDQLYTSKLDYTDKMEKFCRKPTYQK